jgi:hypothetical protein
MVDYLLIVVLYILKTILIFFDIIYIIYYTNGRIPYLEEEK